MNQEQLKGLAAARAAELVEDGMKLGLGTGSTAHLVLEAIAARRDRGELGRIVGVATSRATERLAERLEIPLAPIDDAGRLDLTLDGADEVDPALDLIKGLGGALLWEKIIASVTARLVIVVDGSKRVDRLGEKAPVPVEVVPFGWRTALPRVLDLGGTPRLRTGSDGSPFVTDSGHYILDCRFPDGIRDPYDVQARLVACPAIVETGLFLGMTDTVVLAEPGGVQLLRRSDRP